MIRKAGSELPFVQSGMVVVNEEGEKRIVGEITGNTSFGFYASLFPYSTPSPKNVSCEELKKKWVLAEDFEDGD